MVANLWELVARGNRVKAELNEIVTKAVEVLPEAVLLTEIENGQEKVIFVNDSFERLTGYSMEELEGQAPTILDGPDPASLRQALSSCDGDEFPRETVLCRKNGTSFIDRIRKSRYRMGNKMYSLQVHTDVTQQREIENRFLLAQKREAGSHLVSGLAHDFNNLLTAILVYSGLMEPKVKDDAQGERYLGEIRGAAERGAQVVAELMNLGREDSAEPKLIDLGELVGQSNDLLKRILREDIRLRVEVQPELHRVRVPAGRIQQVLLNLGINAKDAMPQGGDFLLRLANQESPKDEDESAAGNWVSIEVKDNGTGMDSDTCANLFKPFFSTKGKGKGNGLGLFTSRTIIEHYGGRISVESEIGKGTVFKILLPAVLPEPSPASKVTLLLVEGEEASRRSLNATLSQRGYKVLPAANSDQALAVAQSYSGDIALLLANVHSPEAGPQLGKKILKVRPQIKVLFICPQNNGSHRPTENGEDFVRKPFSPSVLVHKIEEVISKPVK